MNVVFRMATRKIINQNVSSGQAKLSTETLADLKRLHLVVSTMHASNTGISAHKPGIFLVSCFMILANPAIRLAAKL